MDRLRRSFLLLRQTWHVLRQDRELLLFPVLSGAAAFVVAATFLVPLGLWSHHGAQDELGYRVTGLFGGHGFGQVVGWVLLFLFYFVNYLVVTFFGTGLAACALHRMDGGDPTVRYGLQQAAKRWRSVVSWAALAATVGLILRLIEERSQWVGRLVASIVGMAWTVATYFVVPVLVVEGSGPMDALRHSVALLRKTWGEALIGHVSISLAMVVLGLVGLVPAGIGVMLMSAGGVWSGLLFLAIAVLYWVALSVVSSTLSSIYNAAVYRYATQGVVAPGFTPELITGAFAPRPRRGGLLGLGE